MNPVYEIIKSISKYERTTEPKHISASAIGGDMLQNYLRIKNPDKLKEEEEVTQSSLGSVFHKGLEAEGKKMYKPDEVEFEVEVKRELPNGWTLTGTIDMVDHINEEIHDYKLSKTYAAKMVKKEMTHTYRFQLNAYKYLLNKPYSMVLDFFMKDQKPLDGERAYEIITVNDIDSFEYKLVSITDELQGYLDRNEEPPKCDEWLIYSRKLKTTINQKCLLYCDVSHLCPHSNQHLDFSRKVDMLAGW
jgi:hypothetical protein